MVFKAEISSRNIRQLIVKSGHLGGSEADFRLVVRAGISTATNLTPLADDCRGLPGISARIQKKKMHLLERDV